MKTIISLGLLFIILTGSVVAQDTSDCQLFAQEAFLLLDEAQTAIEADDTGSALANITDAQDKLAGCNPDAETINDDDEINTATNESEVIPAKTDDEPSEDFTVNTPEVNPENSISFLQFGNWSPDVGNLDFYIGNNTTPIVENLAYQEFTQSLIVNSGELSVIARPAGSGADGDVLSELNWSFQGNSSWTVSGIGLQSEFAFWVEPISIIRTDYNDQARIRVINLIATRQRATVNTDSGNELANGINWVGLKDTMVDPATYTLNIELADNTKIEGLITQDVKANVTYTVVLTGMNTDEQPVQAIVMENLENSTRVKFISQRSDAIEIFIMPAGIEVVDQLEPETETDWIALPSGSLTFILYAPDTGPTSQELAGISRQLRPGRDVTIIADDSGLQLSEEAITP
jgi:hypothetical protein